MGGWLAAAAIATARLDLEPLRVDHAPEVAAALADPALHVVIGGRPATELELRERFARQVAGTSPDGAEGWLNWVVRERGSGEVVGTLQATVRADEQGVAASLAWIVATAHQRQGIAGEGAAAVAAWLHGHGVARLRAWIAPGHAPSEAVATRLGMAPSGVRDADGEQRWDG